MSPRLRSRQFETPNMAITYAPSQMAEGATPAACWSGRKAPSQVLLRDCRDCRVWKVRMACLFPTHTSLLSGLHVCLPVRTSSTLHSFIINSKTLYIFWISLFSPIERDIAFDCSIPHAAREPQRRLGFDSYCSGVELPAFTRPPWLIRRILYLHDQISGLLPTCVK